MEREFKISQQDIPEAPSDTRCEATFNPGVWPYVSRCIKYAEPPHKKHEDKMGKKWSDAS